MRSCRRWQLYGLQLVLRGDLSLGMHSKFQHPRRSHVAPGLVLLNQVPARPNDWTAGIVSVSSSTAKAMTGSLFLALICVETG